MISKANFEILIKEGRTFEDYFRFREEDTAEQVESEVLENIDIPDDVEEATEQVESEVTENIDTTDEEEKEENSSDPLATEPEEDEQQEDI